MIPEYVSNGTSITDGEIYKVYPDGHEELVATYSSKDRAFV